MLQIVFMNFRCNMNKQICQSHGGKPTEAARATAAIPGETAAWPSFCSWAPGQPHVSG
jgi:hypothetical protein